MGFATPIHTNEQSIDRVLQTGLPTMLVFWKPGCGPCKQLDSALAQLAIRYEDQALIAKVNVEDNPALAERYKLSALPGLVFVKGEQQLGRGAGAAPYESLDSWLRAMVGGGSLPAPPSGPSEPFGAPAAGAPAGTGTPLVLTDATFDATIRGSLPVLVDFWAPWCGPCRTIAPSIEQLAKEFAGRAVVAKLNVDDNQRTAQRYQVQSIPTLYIFKRGQVAERLVGAQPIQSLRQALARHTV